MDIGRAGFAVGMVVLDDGADAADRLAAFRTRSGGVRAGMMETCFHGYLIYQRLPHLSIVNC